MQAQYTHKICRAKKFILQQRSRKKNLEIFTAYITKYFFYIQQMNPNIQWM